MSRKWGSSSYLLPAYEVRREVMFYRCLSVNRVGRGCPSHWSHVPSREGYPSHWFYVPSVGIPTRSLPGEGYPSHWYHVPSEEYPSHWYNVPSEGYPNHWSQIPSGGYLSHWSQVTSRGKGYPKS